MQNGSNQLVSIDAKLFLQINYSLDEVTLFLGLLYLSSVEHSILEATKARE